LNCFPSCMMQGDDAVMPVLAKKSLNEGTGIIIVIESSPASVI
jgi:hypothetical protein